MNIKYSQFGTWAPKCVSEEQQAVWKCEKSSEPQLTTSWSGLLMLTDGEARLRKTLSVSKGLKGNKAAKVWLIGKQLNDSTLNRQRENGNSILPKKVSNWDLQLQVWDWEALWGSQLQKDKQ